MKTFNIPSIVDSLKADVESGKITIRQAAEELFEAGWMNFIDETKTKELLKIQETVAMSKADKINEIMRKHNLHGEAYDESDRVVAVEIHWGDWKHNHLRLKWLVEEGMPDLKKVQEEVTEENGTDCYSAIHRFYF